MPALNEEGSVGQVIKAIKSHFDEIIVVDDGSSDNTYREILDSGAWALRHRSNRGQGAALETGNELARRMNADIVVHFDADGQFLPVEIPEMLAPVLSGEADICFGTRFGAKKSQIPFVKDKVLFPLARLVNRLLFRIELTDPQIGFRVLNKKALDTIRIELDDYAHCTEIIFKASHSDLRIKEVPVTVVYHEFGVGFKQGIKIFKDLLIAKLLS